MRQQAFPPDAFEIPAVGVAAPALEFRHERRRLICDRFAYKPPEEVRRCNVERLAKLPHVVGAEALVAIFEPFQAIHAQSADASAESVRL